MLSASNVGLRGTSPHSKTPRVWRVDTLTVEDLQRELEGNGAEAAGGGADVEKLQTQLVEVLVDAYPLPQRDDSGLYVYPRRVAPRSPRRGAKRARREEEDEEAADTRPVQATPVMLTAPSKRQRVAAVPTAAAPAAAAAAAASVGAGGGAGGGSGASSSATTEAVTNGADYTNASQDSCGYEFEYHESRPLPAAVELPVTEPNYAPLCERSATNHWRSGGRQAMYTDASLMVNDTIADIFKKGTTVNGKGEEVALGSAVNPLEGRHLYNCVKWCGARNTLEVGMANGMSTLFIAQAVVDNGGGRHTSIDPFQATQWANAGRASLQRAKLDDMTTCIEGKSMVVMADLLRRGMRYDFVFIDGQHLYDYTMVDLFFADLLLKPGGMCCVDDITMDSVSTCVKYIASNYKHWTLLRGTPCSKTLATFHKLKEDSRAWNYHVPFDTSCTWRRGNGGKQKQRNRGKKNKKWRGKKGSQQQQQQQQQPKQQPQQQQQ